MSWEDIIPKVVRVALLSQKEEAEAGGEDSQRMRGIGSSIKQEIQRQVTGSESKDRGCQGNRVGQ